MPAGATTAGWKVVRYNGNGGAVYGAVVRRRCPRSGRPARRRWRSSTTRQRRPAERRRRTGSPWSGRTARSPSSSPTRDTFAATGGPAAGMTSIDIGVAAVGQRAPVGTHACSKRNDRRRHRHLRVAGTGRGHRRARVNPPARAGPPPSRSSRATPTDPRDRRGAGHRRDDAQPPASRSPCAASSWATSPASAASTSRTPTVTATPPTSDGIFVFSAVRGRPRRHGRRSPARREEFGGQTQINSRADVAVCADGTAANLPAAAPLDLPADDAARERSRACWSPRSTRSPSARSSTSPVRRAHARRRAACSCSPTELARPGTRGRRGIAADNERAPDPARRRRRTPAGQRRPPGRTCRRRRRCGSATSSTFTAPLVLGYGFGELAAAAGRDGTAGRRTFAPQNTRPRDRSGRGRRRHQGGRVQRAQLLHHADRSATPAAPPARPPSSKQAAKIVTAISALDADVVDPDGDRGHRLDGFSPGNADGGAGRPGRRAERGRRRRTVGLRPARRPSCRPSTGGRHPQRDHLPQGRRPAGRRPGRTGGRGRCGSTPASRSRRPSSRTATGSPSSPTTSSPRALGAPTGDNVDTGDGQGQ